MALSDTSTRIGKLALAARKPIVLDVSLSLITRVAMILVGLASAVITARALGTAGRGQYVYISTLGLLAVQFANLGLSTDNARNAASRPHLQGVLAGNSLWAAIFLGLLAAGAMAFYDASSGVETPLALVAVLSLFVPSTLYGVLASNILVGLGQLRSFNLYTLASNVLQLGAIATAGFLSGNAQTVLWANAAAVFVSSLALFFRFRLRSPDAARFNFGLMNSGLAFAGRVYLITLLGFAMARTNVLMLSTLSSKTELGIYSIAMQFVDALMLVPATIAMILFPELVKAGGARHSLAPTVRVAGWTALLMLPVILLLWILAPWIVISLFGRAFTGAADVLRIMLPGTFALGVATIFSQCLSADGVPKVQIAIWAAASFLLISGSYVLIPQKGASGAAVAFSCSYALVGIGLISLVFWRARQAA